MASNVYAKNEGMNLQYLQKNEGIPWKYLQKMRITIVFEQLFETCKKVCVFDSTPTLGLYNISKPNVALSSSVNS